jgi:hypothetical protein
MMAFEAHLSYGLRGKISREKSGDLAAISLLEAPL